MHVMRLIVACCKITPAAHDSCQLTLPFE
jgi:hypothetical protein